METKSTTLMLYTCLFILFIAMIGCDSNSHINDTNELVTSGSSNEALASNIVLDSGYQQERRSFSTEDEYFALLEQIENGQEKVILNVELYASLKHARTAGEISLLDMKGEVEVGSYIYEVDEVAVYRLKSDNTSSNKELVQYYGLDGYHDLYEISEVIGNFALGQVDQIDVTSLKDPQARDLYWELLTVKNTEHNQMKVMDIQFVICDFELPDSQDACFHYFHLNEVISWPGGGNLLAGTYEPVIGTYNQSYTSGLSKKGRAVTLGWIRPSGTLDPYVSMYQLGATGSNAQGTIGLRFLLEAQVTTNTGTSYIVDYGAANVSRSRGSNSGTTSRHWARVDFQGNSSYPYFITNYYVP
jgi:hypothetical protein